MGCVNNKQKVPASKIPPQNNQVQQVKTQNQIKESNLHPNIGSNVNQRQSNVNQSNVRSSAGSRKKSLLRSNVRVQAGQVSSFKQRPRATEAYTVDSMIPSVPIQATNFTGVNNFKVPTNPVVTRDQVYDEQETGAVKSRLLDKNELLQYDLDTEDGVSNTPMINTFQYKTVLNHNLYLEGNKFDRNDQGNYIRPTSSRVMVSEEGL